MSAAKYLYEREKYPFAMNLVKTEKFYDEFDQHTQIYTDLNINVEPSRK